MKISPFPSDGQSLQKNAAKKTETIPPNNIPNFPNEKAGNIQPARGKA